MKLNRYISAPGWTMRVSAGWDSTLTLLFSVIPWRRTDLPFRARMKMCAPFWVRHGVACRRIAAYFAEELGTHCLCNIWIPDGLKDVPADRLSPRLRLRESLDEIFAGPLPGGGGQC